METLQGIEKVVQDVLVVPVPGASHWVQQEEPDIVNKHVDEWLGRKT